MSRAKSVANRHDAQELEDPKADHKRRIQPEQEVYPTNDEGPGHKHILRPHHNRVVKWHPERRPAEPVKGSSYAAQNAIVLRCHGFPCIVDATHIVKRMMRAVMRQIP